VSTWPRGRSADGGIDEIPLGDQIEGRLWLCGKHLVGPDPEAALVRVGATSVLCLTERHELESRYPEYVRWLIDETDRRATWFPTPDLGVRPLDDYLGMLEPVVEHLGGGARLIAHCGAGIGRAGTFAVCVLVALGATPDDATQIVADSRPLAGPEVGPQAELVGAVARRFER
jgi:protein-tyrosine phosphatase